jgi:hypothetical protein
MLEGFRLTLRPAEGFAVSVIVPVNPFNAVTVGLGLAEHQVPAQ